MVILHIPHSSIHIPFYDGYVVNKDEIRAEQLIHTDWYTDDLFQADNTIPVIANFSRLFCDVERVEDDAQEIMSVGGMGVLYEKKDNRERLRVVDAPLRKRIIDGYYKTHHANLSHAVTAQLEQYDKAVIIDCHSFPSKHLVRDLNKDAVRPDYNIGTDPFHTPTYLVNLAKKFFEKRNLSLGIDWPYSGSIVPAGHYGKDKKVQTIMLEINRSMYLEEGTCVKSANYYNVKKIVTEFIQTISSHLNMQQHQLMLSALVTKGYNNLSDGEQRYWNSVY